MSLKEALQLFNESRFSGQKIVNYSVVPEGIVLIGMPHDVLDDGNIYYLVKNDKTVISTNPILCELSKIFPIK